MRESYPPADAASSPAPDLPAAPPAKLQFSLRQLLLFMLASAVFAAGARYVLQLFGRIPDTLIAGYLNTIVLSLIGGAFLYFLLRVPFLMLHAARVRQRWRAVSQHRRELEQWSRERVKQRAPEAGSGGPSRGSH